MKPQKQSQEFIQLIDEIKDVVSNSKSKVRKEINNHLLMTYWQIGKIITEKENNEGLTSRQLILDLSKELSRELGRGFSRSNLFNMRMFYNRYKSVQTVSGHHGADIYARIYSVVSTLRKHQLHKEESNLNIFKELVAVFDGKTVDLA